MLSLISVLMILAGFPVGVGKGVPSSAEQDKGILVVVTMDNCAACERDKPVVEKIRKLGVDVRSVDKDDLTDEQKKKYGIRSYPTYLYFRGGKYQWRMNIAKRVYEKLKREH